VKALATFGRFWWDFVVGDDWVVAVGAVAGLAGTATLAHFDVHAWWLMPLVVAALLALSLRRSIR
jgi:hypothetical protein